MDTFAPQHATNARRLSRDDLDAVVGIDARLEGHTRRTYFERRLAAAVREPTSTSRSPLTTTTASRDTCSAA
jgi:hypothetical protein